MFSPLEFFSILFFFLLFRCEEHFDIQSIFFKKKVIEIRGCLLFRLFGTLNMGLFIFCGGSILLNEFFDHLRKMKTTSAYCFLVMVEFFTACPQCFM